MTAITFTITVIIITITIITIFISFITTTITIITETAETTKILTDTIMITANDTTTFTTYTLFPTLEYIYNYFHITFLKSNIFISFLLKFFFDMEDGVNFKTLGLFVLNQVLVRVCV